MKVELTFPSTPGRGRIIVTIEKMDVTIACETQVVTIDRYNLEEIAKVSRSIE